MAIQRRILKMKTFYGFFIFVAIMTGCIFNAWAGYGDDTDEDPVDNPLIEMRAMDIK